ncbi:Pentatricopeptide repeat-containing protein [Rhynchospora pubera]|uniref:Pentatricopeptide repeat-containing protein n=1 Tax=Rhynchospora pubera TaxID=906938 RepID=A0AAV8F608_9POAL|nr:Pentatricopeptide repeat-containing protein [Rhynchospora pubera]
MAAANRILRCVNLRIYPPFGFRLFSTSLDEQSILQQLSELLPITNKPVNPIPISQIKPVETPPPAPKPLTNRLLSPQDQLRGVFLQKLRGRSAVESALSSTGVDLTVEIFSDVVNNGSLSGECMVSFFDWSIKQPNIKIDVGLCNIVLRALGRRKFFVFFYQILERMRIDALRPDLRTVEILIDSFVADRKVSKAVDLFERLEEIGSRCDSDSLNVLLKCLCNRSHVGLAYTTFNSMKGKIECSKDTYNLIIGGWAKYGNVDKVESCMRMMVNAGFKPDNVTYCYFIEALGRARRVDDSVKVFDELEANGCVRDTMVYNALISNFISIGDLEKCIEYYKDMLRNNSLPDIDTYHKLISSFLKARRIADALDVFDGMLDRGVLPTTGMITSFLEPLCNFGPPHAAMLIYQKSKKAGCVISFKAYKLLLMRLSRFGKSSMVLRIWEEMQESGYDSDDEVYGFIVNGLCNVGKVDIAVSVVEESLRKGICLDKVVYSKLNNKLMEMNKVEIAYKLFLKVKDVRAVANSRSFWRSNGWHF